MEELLQGDETQRLAALHAYKVLDSAPEKDFDDLVRLASQICGTPIALISLIDESRQWFKAKHGADLISTPREYAFCRYTIQQPDVMVVSDAANDPRFSDNPLVTGEPNIRFYAGAPLIAPNQYRIGTICVLDRKTGSLSPEQREALASLSRQVVTQLELRRTVDRLSETVEQRDAAIFRNARTNLELANRNAFNESMKSALNEGIIVQSLNHGVEDFNPSACRILNLNPDQLRGQAPIDLRWDAIHEDGSPFPVETYPAMVTLRTGEACTDVVMGLRLPGTEPRWISINTCLLRKDQSTDPNKVVVSFHDITELLRVQHELASARDTAHAANLAKSQFLANMSHEIRTPMTAILGFAERLQERDITPVEQVDCIQTIRRNGAHLLKIVDDVLDLSKIEARKMTIERVAVQPVQLVEDVVSLMRMRAADRGLGFTVSYQQKIPQTILSDPTRLRQILINLLGNAIKFTSTGEIRIEVSRTSVDDKPRLHFSVTDTGLGMTAEQIGRLFQPFSQADPSTTRQFGGTGLGLAICRGLAERMGGTLDIQSVPGRGSMFTLSIDAETTANLPPVPVLSPPLGTLPLSLRGRILLAEDGQDNQRLISHFLRKAGAEVVVVENGRVAVDLVTASLPAVHFDLIVMDMQMPVMDGYTATQALRSRGWTGPILALTAHAFSEERRKCLDAGCSGYLSKPVTRDRLIHEAQAVMLDSRATPMPPHANHVTTGNPNDWTNRPEGRYGNLVKV